MREVVGEIGDGVPLVEVDLRPGREPERKKALVDAIAEILNDTMGVEAADVYVPVPREPGGESLLWRHAARPLGARRRIASKDAASSRHHQDPEASELAEWFASRKRPPIPTLRGDCRPSQS